MTKEKIYYQVEFLYPHPQLWENFEDSLPEKDSLIWIKFVTDDFGLRLHTAHDPSILKNGFWCYVSRPQNFVFLPEDVRFHQKEEIVDKNNV